MQYKKLILPLILLLLFSLIAAGCVQRNIEPSLKETGFSIKEADIRQDNMLKHIEELISDKYKGRMVGTEGNRLAADYICDYFEKLDLKVPS